MAKLNLAPGTTSRRVKIFVVDTSSAVGAGLSGLVFNSAGLVAWYNRDGDATSTQINLVTATHGTWVSGGFVATPNMPGCYEFDLPNAVLAGGDALVLLYGAANMPPITLEIQTTGSPLDLTTEVNKVETGWTVQQALRAILSSLGGKLAVTNAGATNTVRDVNDTRNSLVYTVDASGNRTAVTYNN